MKVSVLVPVYNSEKFLAETLSSILNQDYRDMEVVILDDGSTDSSPFIISSFSKDQRVKVVRRENEGIGSGRNRLLKEAGGDYVLFVDSDDILSSPSFISRLVGDAEESGAEIVVSRTVPFRKKPRVPEKGEKTFISGKMLSEGMTAPFGFFCYSHSRLVKRSLFEGERFPEDMIFEDVVVMPWVARKAERVVVDSNAIYSYRINPNGLSHSPFSIRSLFEMDAYFMNIERSEREGEGTIGKNSALFFLTKYYWYLLKVIFSSLSLKEYLSRYKGKPGRAWRVLFGGRK